MTERVTSGLRWRGLETDYGGASQASLVRHRHTKETVNRYASPYGTPRQSSTLPCFKTSVIRRGNARQNQKSKA